MKYEFYLAKHIISYTEYIVTHCRIKWVPAFFISKNKRLCERNGYKYNTGALLLKCKFKRFR